MDRSYMTIREIDTSTILVSRKRRGQLHMSRGQSASWNAELRKKNSRKGAKLAKKEEIIGGADERDWHRWVSTCALLELGSRRAHRSDRFPTVQSPSTTLRANGME